MSTNYYAQGPFPGGDTTGPDGDKGIHIGQHAAGWTFLFASHPQLGLITYKAWAEFIRRPGVAIKNEYGRDITIEEMDETMTERAGRRLRYGSHGNPRRDLWASDHIDPDGHHAFHEGYFC